MKFKDRMNNKGEYNIELNLPRNELEDGTI